MAGWVVMGAALSVLSVTAVGERTVAEWDFNNPAEAAQWRANAHLAGVTIAKGALQCRAIGDDPILELVAPIEFAASPWQFLEVRLRASHDGTAEWFWSNTTEGRHGGFTQQKATRFAVRGDGEWGTWRVLASMDWRGRILALGVQPSDEPGARARLGWLKAGAAPTGPPRLEVMSFAPEDSVLRVGRPARLSARIANLGATPLTNTQTSLAVPGGMRVLTSPGSDGVPLLAQRRSVAAASGFPGTPASVGLVSRRRSRGGRLAEAADTAEPNGLGRTNSRPLTAGVGALSGLRAGRLPPRLSPSPDEGALETWRNHPNCMRILHLFSDYRWTGPADPVLNLVQALRGRGIDATLACGNAPAEVTISLPQKAAERGFPVELRFHLDRYCGLFHTISDLWRLPRYLRRERINIVHTHLSHDHVMGTLCARLARRGILVVRTNHKGEPAANSRINTRFLRCCTDAYVGFSRRVVEEDRMRLGLPAERVCTVHPALDLGRFDPSKRYKDVRGELDLPSAAVVGGIVARVQRHRRFEILIEAIKRASEVVPELRFLIIGRGERLQRNVMEPVAALGLERVVLLPGYRSDDYVDYLNALDFKVFLVPGSDGTCRAAREAMAMGKPVIAARRGMLDELVPNGEAGLVVEDTAENLAAAIIEITRNAELRNRLGQGARAHALRHFRLEDQAAAIAGLYVRLSSDKNPKTPSA